jgi:hypothetical protein
MESCILDCLKVLGYDGALLNEADFTEAVDAGTTSIEFSKCVAWLTAELVEHSGITEQVNAIAGPDDAGGFILELSGVLREYGCPYTRLTEGPLNERFYSRDDRLELLNFLVTEVQAVRIIAVNRPELTCSFKNLNLQPMETNQSDVAVTMKQIMVGLDIPKPPPDIGVIFLFQKISEILEERISLLKPPAELGKPVLSAILTDSDWQDLEFIVQALREDYECRRTMVFNRLDVTIKSFAWSGRLKNKDKELAAAFDHRRRAMSSNSRVDVAYILAAKDDLLLFEKTCSESTRHKTKCSVNPVLMGPVPDRGGRAYELDRPLRDMPSFQKRQSSNPVHQAAGFSQRDGSSAGNKRRGKGAGKKGWEQPKKGCFKND